MHCFFRVGRTRSTVVYFISNCIPLFQDIHMARWKPDEAFQILLKDLRVPQLRTMPNPPMKIDPPIICSAAVRKIFDISTLSSDVSCGCSSLVQGNLFFLAEVRKRCKEPNSSFPLYQQVRHKTSKPCDSESLAQTFHDIVERRRYRGYPGARIRKLIGRILDVKGNRIVWWIEWSV